MRTFTIALILALLAALPSAAQTETYQPTFVGDHPAVKAAVERFLAEQATASPAKSTGVRFTAASPAYGSGYQLQSPPVALRLNRTQFGEKEALQSSLIALPEASNFPGPVGISHTWVLIDLQAQVPGSGSYYVRSGWDGIHVLIPGTEVPLQTYIFDGSEPSGLYAYVVMIHDAKSGQFLAMPGAHFVFRNFVRTDNRWYARIDSAELVERNVVLRGNFAIGLGQFAVIGGQVFPIIKSTGTEAVIDLGYPWALPTGIRDVTLVIHTLGNTAYDSVTAPCALRLFLPLSPSGKG